MSKRDRNEEYEEDKEEEIGQKKKAREISAESCEESRNAFSKRERHVDGSSSESSYEGKRARLVQKSSGRKRKLLSPPRDTNEAEEKQAKADPAIFDEFLFWKTPIEDDL